MTIQRVLMLAADGFDPALLSHFMGRGELPHIAGLAQRGLYTPLITSFPPVSPVAWTSMLTGCTPAQHGILDFVLKARRGYHPTIGLYRLHRRPDGSMIYASRRAQPLISEWLARAGRRAYLLFLPGTFPAPTQTLGGVLSGFGVPDLLGTFGLPALYAAEAGALPAALRSRPDVHGLEPAGTGLWQGRIQGPEGTSAPFSLSLAGETTAFVFEDGRRVDLPRRAWSAWIPVGFSLPAGHTRRGIFRLCLLEEQPPLLFRTPVQPDPFHPDEPLCAPADFSARLARAVGYFPSGSFPMEQSAYQDGLLPADAFLQGAYLAWEEQVRVAEHILENEPWDLLALHLFSADAIQHLFWPDVEGEIVRAYRWLDGVLGRLLEKAGDETTVVLASDHGVSPVEKWVHLNVWLHQGGYLALDAGGRVDWPHTRAFCIGYGGIYIHLAGREPAGLISAGPAYDALREEIIAGLLHLVDPNTGETLVSFARRREEMDAGRFLEEMPDIALGFRRGYALAHMDARGACPAGTPWLEPNRTRWRAGHEGPHAPEDVPGVLLIAGRGIPPGQARRVPPHLEDIFPTLCRLLDIPIPPGMGGRPIL